VANMGDDSKTNNPYRFGDDKTDLLRQMKPTEKRAAASAPISLDTRTIHANRGRVLFLCILPLLPAVLLVISAMYYYRVIPPGDASLRYLAVGLCSFFSGGLVATSVFIYLSYALKSVIMETRRLVIRDSDSMLAADWHQIVVKPVQGSFVKICTLEMAGRTCWIDSVFFPEFPVAVKTIKERVDAANAAMNSSTVVL